MTSPVDVVIVVAYHRRERCLRKRGSSHTVDVKFSGVCGIFWVNSFVNSNIRAGDESSGLFDIGNREGTYVCLVRGGHGCSGSLKQNHKDAWSAS